jgi:PAS domain S-box-containing protein
MLFGQQDQNTHPSFSPDPSYLSKETVEILSYQSLLLDQVHDAVVGTDENLVIQYWNKAAEQLLGWKAEEAIGKTPGEIFHANISEALSEKLRQSVHDQERLELSGVSYKRAGQSLFLDLTATQIRSAGNRLHGYAMTIRDVTEQKKNETAARESQERLALALQAANMIAWEWDLCQNRMITHGNSIDFFGEANVQRGEDAIRLVHREDLYNHLRNIKKVIHEGGEYYSEFRIIRPDNGEIAWLEEWCIAINGPDGRVQKLIGVAKNVTERRQAEERIGQLNQELAQRNTELTNERSRWQGVVKGIAEEVWVCDLQGNTSLMNLQAVSPLGLEEFRDIPLDQVLEEMEILTPDGQPRQPKHAPLLRALQGEIVRGEEIMRHSQTGNTRYRQYSSAPTRGPDGAISGAVAIVRDITDYKQAELTLRASEAELRKSSEALRASEERLQLATEAAQLGTWEWLPEHDYSITNEIFYRLHGVEPPPDLRNRQSDFLNWVHPEDRERMKEVILQSIRDEPVTERPYRVIRPDGEVRWMQSFRKNIFEHGKLVRQIGAVMDITERIASEMALRKGEERFRIALSNAAIAVFSTDRELRYTWYYNSEVMHHAVQFIGKRDDEILPAENVAELMALKRQALESGKEIRGEISIKVSSGSRNMIVSIEPLFDEQGQPDGVIGACQDVTNLRRLEAQQIEFTTQMEVQRRLMEQREQDRQSIAREIHDGPIQTLASTTFNLQYLKDAFEIPAMREGLEQVRLNVKSAVQELRDVINELRPPALLRFGLTKAMEQHAEDFREKHPQVELILELEPVDTHLNEQRCLVLFRTYQEGMRNITRHAQATRVWVRLIQEKGIVLEIRDNGKGFPVPLDLSSLTQNQHYGLAGIKERIEAIGGEFRVESNIGEGTNIWVKVGFRPLSPGVQTPG